MLLFAHVGLALASVGLALASSRSWKWVVPGFLALGSMLPDIIDKPLGQIFFGTPAMGRTFAHTLLFLLILLSLAYSMRNIMVASISLGVLIHLALDFMWANPVTLFWPVLGNFPVVPYLDTVSYIDSLLNELHNPAVLVPEMVGLSYIIYLASGLVPEMSKKSQEGLRVLIQFLFKS